MTEKEKEKKRVLLEEKVGVWVLLEGRWFLNEIRHRFDVGNCGVLLDGEDSQVAEVFHEAVAFPTKEEFYLGAGEALGMEDNACSDAEGMLRPTVQQDFFVFGLVQVAYCGSCFVHDGFDICRGKELGRACS